MDSIASILPQIASANGATGNAAPDAAESGLFASLLAVQTTPVSPVPAVNPRPQGNTHFAPQSPASDTGAVLANLPTGSTTPSIAASSTTGHSAATALPITSPGDPALTTATMGDQTALQSGVTIDGATTPPVPPQTAGSNPAVAAGATGQTAIENPVMNTNAAVEPGMPVGPETALPSKSATGVTKETAKPAANMAGPSNHQVPQTATAPAMSAPTATPTASTATPATPTATGNPDAAVLMSQTAALSTLPITPQAGVQARRDAAPGERASASIATAAGSKSASASPTPGSNAMPPDLKSASTPPPPTALPPQGQPPQGDIQPDAARLGPAGDKPPPPPLAELGGSDAETDGERVDLSTLRAAETSRTAERPGTAAGTARFTPATAGSLAAQIAAKFQNGDRKFAIRMDPPELGKIEVKLHVGNDNRVHAILSAERPETLNDMRQYARDLERALEEAGLQLENDGLSFELSQGEENGDEAHPGPGGFSDLEFAEDLSGPVTAAAAPAELYGFRLTAPSGVNIRL